MPKPIGSGATLKVAEIFSSIEGETSFAGLPCSFVRLAGCNLRCGYCDTAYARSGGEEIAIESVMTRISKMGHHLVCITGGEPLLQAGSAILAAQLIKLGHDVLVETNGSMPIDELPKRTRRIVDVKTPGSGAKGSLLRDNLKAITSRDELKFVVTGKDDFDWSVRFIKRNRLNDRCELLISPVYGLDPARAAEWIIESGLALRLNLQLHKILWGRDARGV